MPGKPDKKHRIRVRTLDGKSRDTKDLNKLKSNQLGMPHLDIVGTTVANELIICAGKDTHIAQVRSKLKEVGLEEITSGDTATVANAAPKPTQQHRQGSFQQQRGGLHQRGSGQQRQQQGRSAAPATNGADLSKKPYGFVSLPKEFTTESPVWHDGEKNIMGRVSGEIRFEMETLTPLLVGWERQTLNESEEAWAIPIRKVSRNECATVVQTAACANYPDATDAETPKRRRKQQKVEQDRRKYVERVQDHIVDVQVQDAGWSIDSKSVLCPLRAPWGKRPVVIPGDSLKGLLRHELGALLGAPMERVAERSYSYRPNSLFTKDQNHFLETRIAWVPQGGVEERLLDPSISNGPKVRVPIQLELLPGNLRYDKHKSGKNNTYCFDPPASQGDRYLGGQGAGKLLNSKKQLHKKVGIIKSEENLLVDVPEVVQSGYLNTVHYLSELEYGHFSSRHPDIITKTIKSNEARNRILEAAKNEVFQPGDLIWVEWDTEKKQIVSLGWHYYYRWAYTDSVRKTGGNLERHGLFPLDTEREKEGDAPKKLSAVRRLFGYTGDNDGSRGIGRGDHAQLMGRVFVNAGLEVVCENESDETRFLKPTFLRELGMPRPSAVEHYLKQPYHPQSRPSDKATLVTYGDAGGYDAPGELAGRKFYLDRNEAYDTNGNALVPGPASDPSHANKQNERSTLALEASKPGRQFRFTIRFRDLDPGELAAIIVALCPDQFKGALGGTHTDGYCSKLGYARPLGWGSVRIEAKRLLFLDESSDTPMLKPDADLDIWVKNHQKTVMQDEWLAVHRRNHPDAADYPRAKDHAGNENIYTFHTGLRADHSRQRRYKKDGP